MIKKIITNILIAEARIAQKRFHPTIIGITGSVGKSSTKEAIAAVLGQKFRVRESKKSYNSELGLVLSILGLPTAWKNPVGWIRNIIRGAREIFRKDFPEILILEMGIDRPKALDRLLLIARPQIGVVTAIGDIPVHVEFFAGPEELAREKMKLVRSLPASGHAVLNFDDATVWDMHTKTNAHIHSYGFGEHADFMASNDKISFAGTVFKVNHDGASVPVHLKNAFGRQNIYSALAAMAVGKIFDMNVVEIAQAISIFQSLPGRMRLIEGVKQSWILDDSYNASPLALHAAMDTWKELAASSETPVRRIAVLGDMLEIGKFTIEAHQAVGERVAEAADYFVAVGPRMKFAAEEARARGVKEVHYFSTSLEAAAHLNTIIRTSDLILVKGSQSMRMEKIFEEIMAHPEDAEKLLCRQDAYWKKK